MKNAFNSAKWETIAAALHEVKVPDYLCRILSDYFGNRTLCDHTSASQKNVTISAGVLQESILGPTMWNAMYKGVLTLELPTGVKIIGFADDITLVVVGESLEAAEILATEAVNAVEYWIHG